MKMGRLSELHDPEAMIAALRYNTKTSQELVHVINDQNEVTQRTYTALVGTDRKLVAGQSELSQLFGLDLETNEASHVSLDAIKTEMKENSKYTRVSAEFLARIVESLENEDAQSKAKPFSRALVKSGTASEVTDDDGGGSSHGHGGGAGLLDLIGLLFGWKIAKKVFKGIRNMKPTTATSADDVAKMLHPERKGGFISNEEENFTQNSTPNDQPKLGEMPKQTVPDEPFDVPKGFNIQKPKGLPNVTDILKNLGKSVIVKSILEGVARYAGSAAGLIAGRVLGAAGIFLNSTATASADQENAIMGRKPGTGELGAPPKPPPSDVTTLPEVTVTAKRTRPEENPYSSNRGGSPFIQQSSPYSYAPQGTPTSAAGGGSSVPAGGSVTQMPSVPGGKGDVSTGEAMSFFQSPEGGGWTKEQAAGIVANLQHESGLRGSAMGDGGLAYGMGQWHPDRQANFARVFGHPIQQGTPQEQLAFVNWELHNTEKAAGDALSQTKTAQDAGGVVSAHYERPANRQGEAMARGQTAAGLVGQTNTATASLQGSPQSSSGQAVAQASALQGRLQDASKTTVVQPIVSAPVTTVGAGDQNKTAGPMPAVRNDDPILLQAMRQDIKFA
jgi:hypothetical protein